MKRVVRHLLPSDKSYLNDIFSEFRALRVQADYCIGNVELSDFEGLEQAKELFELFNARLDGE
jgi:hypothetical protein